MNKNSEWIKTIITGAVGGAVVGSFLGFIGSISGSIIGGALSFFIKPRNNNTTDKFTKIGHYKEEMPYRQKVAH